MKSYMLAQDLWDLIEPADHQEGDSKAWIKKNAAALHAIQISCSPRILSKIRSIISAKVAWDTLSNSQQQHSPSHEVQSVESELSQVSGSVSNEMNGPLLALYKHAHNGDWDATKNYLDQYPNAIRATIEPYGGTALHVAVSAGNLNIVEELVKLMSEKELEIQDNAGNTALFSAATVGITKMAECLVSKNPNLVTLLDEDKTTPLAEACARNHKDMALYLYSVTPVEFLCQDNGNHGSLFLQYAIGAQMLDIAFDFLHRFPYMTTRMDIDVVKSNPLIRLSGMPEIFQRIKQIYDLKKIHIYSDKILRCMCEYISNLDHEEILEAGIIGAFHAAVKHGMVEFVIEMIKACPHHTYRLGNIFMSSVANRHEKVFSLIYGLETGRALFFPLVDSSSNTVLHQAAKLSPPSQLARISGAALQMQRELQWYKEVESIMNPTDKDTPNENNQTPRELFTHDHKNLLVKGEEWMKGSATSCTVVGALIITIMFTAVFTVPGGNVQETGYPIFKDKKFFTVFIVADAISLFSASTSVLMFLGILTSRYAEEDFLKSLPTKLIFGLSTLFLSIAAMMVTFCAALIIMLNGRLEVVIPVVLLASIPVTFFMFLQFPLLVEIFVSTYGPGIFNKKMKRWY
ncbi:protein ACCELERATED CELL DEATH [Salix suchowensis]|nr:protein ACCELERATED CELL DEATH [Salix suchowensis]